MGTVPADRLLWGHYSDCPLWEQRAPRWPLSDTDCSAFTSQSPLSLPQSMDLHRGSPAFGWQFPALLRLLHRDSLPQWSPQFGCLQGAEEDKCGLGTAIRCSTHRPCRIPPNEGLIWDSKAWPEIVEYKALTMLRLSPFISSLLSIFLIMKRC